MKIYKLAKYYSVNRDDNELRVVICPKCKGSDIVITQEVIALAQDNYALKLCKCNNKKCGVYFSFYREDGTRDITKQEAEQGVEAEHVDLQDSGKNKGMDNHGHCYYVAFLEKPPTISEKEYDALYDMDYDDEQKWKKQNLIELGKIVKLRGIISKIDFDVFDA